MISLIVAYAQNFVIGKDGKIPWDLEDDRQHFKELTLGSVLVMGRLTFEEIYKKFNKGLPGRETIIISKTKAFNGENYQTVESLQAALERAEKQFPEKNIFICGGESVYNEALKLKLPEKLYITEIKLPQPIEGDTFFSQFYQKNYIMEECREIENPIPHKFIVYKAAGERLSGQVR